MGLGTSLLLVAVGAILRFAVTVTTHGFNLHTVGVILMIIGIAGLLISLFWMAMYADRRRVAPVAARDPRIPPDREVY